MTHNRGMLTRDQLAELLGTVNVRDVAREASVSTKTVYRLRHKEIPPTFRTVEKLMAALDRMGHLKPKRKAPKVAA